MSTEPTFGTDGVRGVANQDLTPEFALKLGVAVGSWLAGQESPGPVVIGRDTRQSGTMLEAALAAGLTSTGADVVRLGVAPTPTVAYLARTQGYGLGAVVSASHNPAPDNGIKFFGSNGGKLPDAAEAEIIQLLGQSKVGRPIGGGIGILDENDDSLDSYLDYLAEALPEGLEGMKVAVDCANGAAYLIGPEILTRLGATVYEMGVSPDGININAGGGATKPDAICRFTKETGADFGVAFDGDADRAIFADSNGTLVNGDRTIGIWASYHQELGELKPPSVVGTVMSNGGFAQYLADRGVALLRTPVGDKYVSRELAASGSLIGGEQSGHIIFPHRAESGDGLMTMIELLRVIKRSGKPLAAWTADYQPWPQLLLNLSVPKPKEWDANPKVKAAVQDATNTVGATGRVNVRPSGTQPMLRVMVEADSYEARDAAAAQILAALETELGASVYGKVDLTHALGD